MTDKAAAFWDFVTDVIQPWRAIADGTLDPAVARQDYLSSYTIALWAVANAGRTAIDAGGNWRASVGKLATVDWLKSNPDWQGITMAGSEVITRQPTRRATAELLRSAMGMGVRPAPIFDVDLVTKKRSALEEIPR